MTNKNTDLKFSEVKKRAKQVRQTEQYTLDTGETITFYPIFPHTEIEKMFKFIQKSLETIPEGVEDSPELFRHFINYHIIRHFTHFGKQLKANTYVKQMDELEDIIDFQIDGKSLYTLLMEDIFSLIEIQKVFDYVAKLIATNQFMENYLGEKIKEHFKQIELKNSDTIRYMFGDKNGKNIQNN